MMAQFWDFCSGSCLNLQQCYLSFTFALKGKIPRPGKSISSRMAALSSPNSSLSLSGSRLFGRLMTTSVPSQIISALPLDFASRATFSCTPFFISYSRFHSRHGSLGPPTDTIVSAGRQLRLENHLPKPMVLSHIHTMHTRTATVYRTKHQTLAAQLSEL